MLLAAGAVCKLRLQRLQLLQKRGMYAQASSQHVLHRVVVAQLGLLRHVLGAQAALLGNQSRVRPVSDVAIGIGRPREQPQQRRLARSV